MKTVCYYILRGFQIMLFALIFAVLAGYVFGFQIYFVESGSMEPFMYRDDAILVDKNAKYDDIDVGDIIVYHRAWDNKDIVHRVIAVSGQGLVTQGDNNDAPDRDPVTREMYIGRLMLKIPKIGAFARGLKTVPVAGAFAVILTGIFFLTDLLAPKKKE